MTFPSLWSLYIPACLAVLWGKFLDSYAKIMRKVLDSTHYVTNTESGYDGYHHPVDDTTNQEVAGDPGGRRYLRKERRGGGGAPDRGQDPGAERAEAFPCPPPRGRQGDPQARGSHPGRLELPRRGDRPSPCRRSSLTPTSSCTRSAPSTRSRRRASASW